MKRFNLKNKIIFSIILTTILSILLSVGLLKVYMDDKSINETKASLKTMGDELATDEMVQAGLLLETSSDELVHYTNKLMNMLSVDFIVVMDREFIRLTHPVASKIGQKFSSDDPKKALEGKAYFTQNEGVLGNGFRYFVPVYQKGTQRIIGIICIGKTSETIKSETQKLLTRMYLALGLGILLAIGPIFWIFRDFKKQTDGETIDDILFNYMEQVKVWDGIDEGVVAVDEKGQVIFSNESFKENFQTALMTTGGTSFLESTLFDDLFLNKQIQTNIPLFYEKKEYQFNSYPITEGKKVVGFMATISDKNNVNHLKLELDGAKQYVSALRSQNHEFFNKMHIINALIELERYGEARDFIASLQNDYQEQVGLLTSQIESPLVAGVIMGKIKEAQENKVKLVISKETHLHNHAITKLLYDYLQIMTILMDNAIEACASVANGQIDIELMDAYEEGKVMLGASISNNGPKITLNPITDIYKKGHSSKGEYRGLGMYLAKGMIERNGGVITVESNQEQTTFTFKVWGEESEQM